MASWQCKVAAGGQRTPWKLLMEADPLPLPLHWSHGRGLLRDYETPTGLDVEMMVYGPLPASQQSSGRIQATIRQVQHTNHPASTRINIANNRTEVSSTTTNLSGGNYIKYRDNINITLICLMCSDKYLDKYIMFDVDWN